MTIQDWGSIGELVAAIATVVTLGYLAVQIRANTAALQAEARRSEFLTSDYVGAIIGSSEVARIFNTGMADPKALSPEESTRFLLLMLRALGSEASAFEDIRTGFAPASERERKERNLSRLVLAPGGRWVWQRFHEDFSPEFRSHVDRILANSGPAA